MLRNVVSKSGARIAAAILLVNALGSFGCGDGDSDNEQPQTGGSAGSTGGGGSQSGGSGGKGSGGTGTPNSCSTVAAADDGAVQDVTNPTGSNVADDVQTACDGSFAVVGSASPSVSFDSGSGAAIELTDADTWVAQFDADGSARWATAIQRGSGSTWAYAAPFVDGSVVLGGAFGTSAVFGAGEATETTLTADSTDPNGFVARYDSSGAFQWVAHIGPDDESRVWGVGAGADGVSFASIDTANPAGMTVDPDGLALELAAGEGAIVALDAEGSFTHSSRYSGLTVQVVRFAALSGGGLLIAGEANDMAVLGLGTAGETTLSSGGVFLARFSDELDLESARAVTVPASSDTTALLPDGSAAFAGALSGMATLGAGEPNEVTLTNDAGGSDGVVSRLDPEGQLLWATQLAGEQVVDLSAVSAQPDGSVWVAGTYARGLSATSTSTLVLAPGTAGEMPVETTGQLTFVARFTPDGAPAWVVPFGGSLSTRAIAASPLALIAIGEFADDVSFGSTDFNGDGVFITRIGP